MVRWSVAAVALFVAVVVVLWIRHRVAHEAKVTRLRQHLEEARAKDEMRITFLHVPPVYGKEPCPMRAMETARVFHPDGIRARGIFMRETAAAIEEGREPPPFSAWTYELDVLDDAKRVVLWDFTRDAPLCVGPLTGDDPRGGLVAF